MAGAGTITLPGGLPWSDRGDDAARATSTPRSIRDIEILRSLVHRINPNDAGAYNNLGVVFYNKSLYAEAIEQFERALDLDPRMQVAERNLQIAYFSTGYYDELLAHLHALLERDTEDAQIRDRLASTYFYGGDASAAIREWRRVLHVRPRDARVYRELARAELKRGDLDAALSALRNAAAIDPADAHTQLRIGEVLYQRGLHAEARDPLERAVRQDETLAEAHHLLAFVYGDLGETERANEAVARAAELNPSYTSSETSLSLDRYSLARYEELVGDRSGRPRVAEGGTLAHYNLGLAFRQKALYDEAMREFRLATERGEDAYMVQQAQAEMLLLRGGGEDAAALYRELIEQEPASPKLWNELGVAQHQLGRYDTAENAYRRALELDPAYALAWCNLGVALHYRGANEEAEEAFRSALREGRALADVWRNLGLMWQRIGESQEASSAYRRAIEADPRSAGAWTGLGMLLLEESRPDEAKTALTRAVEADPNMAEARYHLAFALSALGDYPGALRETRHALDLNPYISTPRFRLLIDLQFEEAGVPAPELDIAERVGSGHGIDAFEFNPSSLDAVFGAEGSGQSVDVEPSEPGRALRRPSSPASIESLASARGALESGEYGRAATEAQKAAALGANRVDVLLLQGEIYLASGAAGEAAERFNEVLGELARGGDLSNAGFDVADARRRALLGAARSLMELGRHARAIGAAEQLCEETDHEDVEALAVLGDALFRDGQSGRASVVLERGRALAPRDIGLLTRLGQAHAAAGDVPRAESALREAIEANGDAPAARAVLARLYAEEGRLADARREYRTALAKIPSYGEAAFGLAELELREGRLQDSINAIVELLTVDPYHLGGLVRLGDLLCRAGMESEAGIAYRRVLRFDPSHEEALEGLERLGPAAAAADRPANGD